MKEPARFLVLVFMTTPIILVGVGWRIAPEPQALAPFLARLGVGFVADPLPLMLFVLGAASALASLVLPMPDALPAMRARILIKAALGEAAATSGLVAMLLAKPGADRAQTPLLLGALVAEFALAKLLTFDVPRLEAAAAERAGSITPK
ncbi:MAG TPA: hypothetical protein VMV18_15990 [bacterium]|nr:hypothetical protein [bacterium]